MAGGTSGHIGGVETQTSLMARWFAGRGYQVSMLTCDEGQEDGVEIDGVRIFKMCRRDAGIKGLRFFWPKWSSLIAAMKRADADVYYQNLAECVTGQVAFWCRNHGRRFVFSAAADSHCDARLPYMHTLRDRVLYRYGLRHADTVIVQSRRQQEMLRNGFERDSVVLPMPCPGPSDDDYNCSEVARDGSFRVLWIGRIYEVKRPDWLLDVASACPNVNFDLVGPMANSGYARRVCERAKTISNVTLHGPISRDRVSDFYKKAKLLCCTSESEGFPNTFLEAWSYGLPIVSTFEPDKLITEKGLGIVAKDIAGIADGIRNLYRSPEQWKTMSRRTRQFYLKNYTVDTVMAQFEKVFMC